MNKNITTICVITLFIGITISPAILGEKSNQTLETIELNEFLFNKYITLLMKIAHKPSLSACIIINNNVVWSKGYGLYDIENNKPANTDVLYITASISKTVTATALMQLYDQELFDLDDDINDYLPFNFRNPNFPDTPITFRMLLSHRSSLAGDNLFWLCLSYIPGDPDVPDYPYPWLEEYLTPGGSAYSPRVWSEIPPGEKLQYANIGYSLIGYLVERISGQSFNEYCKDNIFKPLEMHNTSFRLRDIDLYNIAVPYGYKRGNYLAHPHYGMHVIYPAATMRTSVEEYSHFIIAHMNGGVYNGTRILKEDTVELMHTTHYDSKGWNYGLGWVIEKTGFFRIKEVGHSGGWPGVHTQVIIRPEKDTAIIIFTNCLDSELRMTFFESLAFTHIQNILFYKAKKMAS